MTVHDAIPKRKRLIGQCHFFIKPVSVSWRVFALQGGRMDDCPRRYTQKKAAYRSVSLLHKTRQCKLAGFAYRAAGWMTVHDAIPERKRLIGQFHFFIKPASAGFCLQGDRMNDCPRHYTQRKRLIGQFHLFIKSASAGFAYQAGEGYRGCRRRQRHYPAIN